MDSRVRAIFQKANSEHRQVFTELESKAILRFYGIPTTSEKVATTEVEAIAHAHELGYPVVLKICSPAILHKTEVGGVRLGLVDAADVKTAFIEMMATVRQRRPDVTIHGVLVQHMVPDAQEVIVGAKRDPSFGPVVMFGRGGFWLRSSMIPRFASHRSQRRKLCKWSRRSEVIPSSLGTVGRKIWTSQV